ncbi:MAG: hypothetical protein NVV62_13240 [Terricaulis sp.]|nr:hypothetical protein [Terricaulis sp.]
MIGGEGSAIITGTDLVPRVERFTTYGRFEYEFTPNLRGHFALGYSESEGHLTGVPIRLTAQTIRDDNAFLPAEVQNRHGQRGDHILHDEPHRPGYARQRIYRDQQITAV